MDRPQLNIWSKMIVTASCLALAGCSGLSTRSSSARPKTPANPGGEPPLPTHRTSYGAPRTAWNDRANYGENARDPFEQEDGETLRTAYSSPDRKRNMAFASAQESAPIESTPETIVDGDTVIIGAPIIAGDIDERERVGRFADRRNPALHGAGYIATAPARGARRGLQAGAEAGRATGQFVSDTTATVTAPARAVGRAAANHIAHEQQEHQDKKTFKSLGYLLPKKQVHRKLDMGYKNPNFPRELRMASHPEYVVEPPDVLYIEAENLADSTPLGGERLVRQDGTISLGYYGQIHVAGLTLPEIEDKIRRRLSEYNQGPEVYVDVAAFNSKVYYVLGQVQQTGRLPVTGKETVLDGLTLAGGPTNFAKIKEMHVARPNPGGGCDQILWVDYKAITEYGDTRTNYQLLPGDRIMVPSTKGYRTNVLMDNFLTPIDRLASLFSLIKLSID